MKHYYNIFNDNNELVYTKYMDEAEAAELNNIQIQEKLFSKRIDLNNNLSDILHPAKDELIELTQPDRIEAAILRLEIKIDELLEKLNK